MKVVRHGTSTFIAIIENHEEKEYLSQKRERQQEWVPLYLNGKSTPFAEMHLRTYRVRLCKDQQIEAEQQVFLVHQEYSE